jgi:LysM repeat protein
MRCMEGVRWLPGVVLAAMLAGPLHALDKLPTSGCQDRNNLRLLKRCDPYRVRLIHVSEAEIEPLPSRRRIRLGKTLPHSSYTFERRVTLQRLVKRYIEYEEAILQRREHFRKAKKPPETKKPSSPLPEASPAPAPQKRTEPTLHEVMGNRTTGKMVMPLQPRTEFYPQDLLALKKVPEIKEAKEPRLPSKVRHIVMPGETFSGLARLYQTTVFDIRRWNGLSRDHLLKVGEKLTIHPGKKTPPEEIRKALRREKFGTYKVRKGDTLSGIARRFGVKKREISELNELKKGRHLRVGQKLMLPLKQKKIDAILQKEKRFKYVSDKRFKHRIRVIATAYTSHRGQTDRTPFLAAWNNRIRPGMKIIAVSPDLIRRYGITNGTKVKISGLPGIYTVRDKMNKRLRNHIDIYMGTNRRKALRWGRRRVILYW